MSTDPLPPELRALRQMLVVGLLAYVVGFALVFAAGCWLVLHYALPGTAWWNVAQMLVNVALIANVAGIWLVALAMHLLNSIHYRRGIYRCVHCGRPLRNIHTLCDCPTMQALINDT